MRHIDDARGPIKVGLYSGDARSAHVDVVEIRVSYCADFK